MILPRAIRAGWRKSLGTGRCERVWRSGVVRVLLLGAGGLLGGAFREGMSGHVVSIAPREALNVRDAKRVRSLVLDSGAELVVNCAAHTDVDGAEASPEPAYAANTMLPALLAQGCRRSGALMLHVSSTGCYGSRQERPYTEEDALEPTTVHHQSKAAGERAVREAGCEALIVRTGWLFGGSPDRPRNFVWRRLEEAALRPAIASDPTQTGNPTWVDDVVRQCMALEEQRLTGTFNCVAQGRVRRCDYVSSIISLSGLPCRVESSERAFPRPAPVSPNESARNWRLGLLGLDLMPEWTHSLASYLERVRRTPEWSTLTSLCRG